MASPASKRRDKAHSRKARKAIETAAAERGVVIRIVKKSVLERELRNRKVSFLPDYLADIAALWPDERFEAPDGRHFAYLHFQDAIRHRILGMSTVLAPIEERELAHTEAAIIELGESNELAAPPFTFTDWEVGDSAWDALVASFTADAIEAGEA